MASSYDKIPNLLIDRNTILEKQLLNKEKTILTNSFPEGHTQMSYLFCILLRIFIGILILSNKLSNKRIIYLCLIVIIIFGSKYLSLKDNKKQIWKNYLRIILNYLTILIIQKNNIENKNTISGLLVIVDALMGQQSRYITTNMSCSAPN